MRKVEIGAKYGRLTVLGRCCDRITSGGNKKVMWDCICDCGKAHTVSSQGLLTGTSKSCGCYNMEKKIERATTHGKRHTRIYDVWRNMRKRCQKEYDHHYKNYGARGIKVCEDWDKSFQNFYDWAMNNGYTDELTIDRIDVNGNYEPNNCRFVNNLVQSNNKRNSLKYEYNGENKTLREWAAETGLSYATLRLRIHRRHWSIEKALNTPKR